MGTIDSLINILVVVVVLFHKRILPVIGLDPKRLRDMIGILSVGVFILIVEFLKRQPVLSDHTELFLVGLILGVPHGILNATNVIKNIKDNVLYARKGLGFYLTFVVVVTGVAAAAYFHYVTEFLLLAAGMSLTDLALVVFYIVRYEKRFGPVILNRL